jgi:hypothetical protein
VNGQLDHRVLKYEHNLSDGQTVRISDFDPDNPSEWTLVGERREELSQLLRERRRQVEQGQKLATTEERQVHGRVFVFKKQQFVLSDGTNDGIRSAGNCRVSTRPNTCRRWQDAQMRLGFIADQFQWDV